MRKIKDALSAALRRFMGSYLITRTVPGGGYYGQWAGMNVTTRNALTLSGVHRAVSFICDSIMCLPWQVFLADGQQKRRVLGSNLEFILNHQANPELTAAVWAHTMLGYSVLQGNAYAEIARDEQGMAQALGHPLADNQVQLMRDTESEELFCRVWLDQNRAGAQGGQTVDIWYRDMYHLRGMGNSFLGISVIRYAARSLGVGLALDQTAASFFGNGNRTSGAIEYPGPLSQEKKIELGNYIKNELQGPQRSNNLIILDQGMKFASNSMPNDDAQFLQSRQFQINEIARWFNVPVQKLMDYSHSPWGSAEQASIDAVLSGLMPWIHRMESEANAKLGSLDTRGMIQTKMNLMELLRADTKTRSEAYAKGRQWGYLNANEIRMLEDLPSYEGGDVFLSPMNMERIEGGVQEPVFVGRRGRAMQAVKGQSGADRYLEHCMHALGLDNRIEVSSEPALALDGPTNDDQKDKGIELSQALAGIRKALEDQWSTIIVRENHELEKIGTQEKLSKWLDRHELYVRIRLHSIGAMIEAMELVENGRQADLYLELDAQASDRCKALKNESHEHDKKAMANQTLMAIIGGNLLRGSKDDISSRA